MYRFIVSCTVYVSTPSHVGDRDVTEETQPPAPTRVMRRTSGSNSDNGGRGGPGVNRRRRHRRVWEQQPPSNEVPRGVGGASLSARPGPRGAASPSSSSQVRQQPLQLEELQQQQRQRPSSSSSVRNAERPLVAQR